VGITAMEVDFLDWAPYFIFTIAQLKHIAGKPSSPQPTPTGLPVRPTGDTKPHHEHGMKSYELDESYGEGYKSVKKSIQRRIRIALGMRQTSSFVRVVRLVRILRMRTPSATVL
jgi:hypothetical protein